MEKIEDTVGQHHLFARVAQVFDEDNPQQIVSRLLPDVLVKGADWAMDEIIGRDTVESRGGRVVRIPLAEGYSTSAIIKTIRSA